MTEFIWIETSFFLILVLQFTATLGQYNSFIVKVGDEVTLPFSDVREDQDECDGIIWSFSSRNLGEDLVLHGKINKNTKADRLSVTANCSLVIKKVTAKDAGQYICQHKSRTNQVYLFVVNMTEQKDNQKVTLHCSVSPYGECKHTVKWLYEDKDNKDMMTSPSSCSANVTTSLSESEHHELFKCEVTNIFSGKTQLFSYQDSEEKTGMDEKTSTSKPTTTPITKPTLTETPATKPPATTTATKPSTVTNNTISTDSNTLAQGQGWWWFIILAVVLAALFVVVLIRWKRTKGNKTQVDAKTADPEDGVSYASVSFTKNTNSKAQVQGNDGDDKGDAVTYSTVKASSSARVFVDSSNFYATVSKPNI